MACPQNLFDLLADKTKEQLALTSPSVEIAIGIATALDTVLLSVGASTALFPNLGSDLQTELELSHEEYAKDPTKTRTKNRTNCIHQSGGLKEGSQKADEVEKRVIDNAKNAKSGMTGGGFQASQFYTEWLQVMEDIHNCYEELIQRGTITKEEPCERTTVKKNKRVCDLQVKVN